MIMKRLFAFIGLLMSVLALAQNPEVESRLKMRYPLVQYHQECGGWYFLSYNSAGQPMYGFADSRGNVVASDASKYKIHPGYIELYLLDMQQKLVHDQWEVDMRIYNINYNEYQRVEKAYEAEVRAFKAKVEAAESEARIRWKRAQAAAKAQAERETQELQRQAANASGGGILGALVGMAVGGVSKTVAAATVPYEPFREAVLSERGLTVEPSKPYNPKPEKPVEPADGYYWKSFSLRQPCKYDEVDFEAIAESGNFANVRYDGKWGLVDATMKEVIPCNNSGKVLMQKYSDGLFLVRKNSGYGVIDKNGKYVIPATYNSLDRNGSRFKARTSEGYGLITDKGKVIMPCQFDDITPSNNYWLCQKDGKWGVYTSDFDELYPCQYQSESLVQNKGKLILYTKDKGLWGAVEFLTGVELFPNNYASIDFVDLGQTGSYYKVKSGSGNGLYTDKGIMVIPCEYSRIEARKVGTVQMFEVQRSNTKGLFETNGVMVLPPDRYSGYEHHGGFYKVSAIDGRYGVCDLYGTELIPCEYSFLDYEPGLRGFIARKGTMMGVVSMTGEEMFPFVPASSMSWSSSAPEVLQVNNGSIKGYGAVDFKGRVVVPMKNKREKMAKKIFSVKKKDPMIAGYSKQSVERLAASSSQKVVNEERTKIERDRFSFFAQNYVGRIIGEWQKKGEFEKMDVWRKRVNNNTLNQRVFALTKEAQEQYIADYEKTLPADHPFIVGSYDPDNETYRIKTSYSDQDILVHVKPDDALEFKTSFASLLKKPRFFVENDKVGLAEYTFTMPGGRKYVYNNEASLTYSIADVKYDLDAIEIDKGASNVGHKRGKQTISTRTFTMGTSDVDIDIPVTGKKRENTFAVIIANENYDNEKKVDYAYNDGQVFKDYCQKTLGIPAENIHFRPDATLNNMKFDVNWLKGVTKTHPDAQVLFYYAGHGMPDEATRESYLLPIDGYSTESSTGYKLSELYAALGSMPASNVLVFLDACFSGADRSDQVMSNVRGVRIAPRVDRPKGNMVIFTATSSKQTAHPYVEQSHGLFTYYMLKWLQENPDNIVLGNWFNYIRTKVAQKASVVNSKEQTPTAISSSTMTESWKTVTL